MLDLKTYFVREHVGFLKLADTYDILDPQTQDQVAIAKEEPGAFTHIFRFLVNKQLLPTKVVVYAGSDPKAGEVLFCIKRGFTLFRHRVDVLDGNGGLLGWFKSKVFTLGVSFGVFDKDGNEVALFKGDWKGWNFKFLVGDKEIGTVTKKWAGFGKELFTSADNYMVDISGAESPEKSILLLAAALAVDIIYKEH